MAYYRDETGTRPGGSRPGGSWTPIDDSKYRLVAKPERMKVIPNYNFPEINLQWTPEELDGQNIVALIDEAEDRMQREKR